MDYLWIVSIIWAALLVFLVIGGIFWLRARWGPEYRGARSFEAWPYAYTPMPALGGKHKGKGPRGYRRSDERIRDELCDRLTVHAGIDASDIDVEARDGVVTLSGLVGTRAEKRVAEDLADSVPGVVDVNNQLRILAMAPRRENRAA